LKISPSLHWSRTPAVGSGPPYGFRISGVFPRAAFAGSVSLPFRVVFPSAAVKVTMRAVTPLAGAIVVAFQNAVQPLLKVQRLATGGVAAVLETSAKCMASGESSTS
jgi:hypothetical protein